MDSNVQDGEPQNRAFPSCLALAKFWTVVCPSFLCLGGNFRLPYCCGSLHWITAWTISRASWYPSFVHAGMAEASGFWDPPLACFCCNRKQPQAIFLACLHDWQPHTYRTVTCLTSVSTWLVEGPAMIRQDSNFRSKLLVAWFMAIMKPLIFSLQAQLQ
jgi:hypothetical protein